MVSPNSISGDMVGGGELTEGSVRFVGTIIYRRLWQRVTVSHLLLGTAFEPGGKSGELEGRRGCVCFANESQPGQQPAFEGIQEGE